MSTCKYIRKRPPKIAATPEQIAEAQADYDEAKAEWKQFKPELERAEQLLFRSTTHYDAPATHEDIAKGWHENVKAHEYLLPRKKLAAQLSAEMYRAEQKLRVLRKSLPEELGNGSP